MKPINILHLSDIHFKLKEKQTFRDDVEEKMAAAIKTHIGANRAPDFVAVTGDIAFSGKEYDKAEVFFKAVKAVLPPGTVVLPVPGNHDVDRDAINDYFSLHDLVLKNKADGFLENKKGEIASYITPKFKNFRAFANRLHRGIYPSEEDYFWVKNYKKKNVSFLGLNSCWACEGDDDRNNITLGYPQVRGALKKSKISNRILLMHHPPVNWLNEVDFNRYIDEIYGKCSLILHGHTHSDRGLVFTTPSHSCICLGANASYTDDKEDGFIGFQFVDIHFKEEGTAVKVCPYRLDTRGKVRFVEDYHRYEGQKGPCFELGTVEKNPGTKGKPVLPLEIPIAYRDWVKEFHSTMDIDLLARKGEVITVSLPEVYIPIETRNPFYRKKRKKKRKSKDDLLSVREVFEIDEDIEDRKSKESPSIDIEALVGRKNRVLLRGGAGMGKTTLIKHLAYTVTRDTCHPSLKGCLPVMVFLKDLWLIYNEVLEGKKKRLVFEDLLKRNLEKCKCALSWETVSNYLSHHRVLFLIDGLDEVPENLREPLVDMMAEFQFQHKENRFLFTGRPHGVDGRAKSRFGEDLHDIEPLDDKKIDDFIKNWFRAVSGRAVGLGAETAEGMISDIRLHEHISVLIQNPLLLTAVCILYQDGKRIPDQRADLYNRIIDNLIRRRFHDPAQPGKENEILEFLMTLAFETQKKNRKTIEIDDALEILEKTAAKKEGENVTRFQWIKDRFSEIEPRCGLFNRLDGDKLEFTHLTFQEFLAAKHMMNENIDYTQFLDSEWWEETLLLYTGFMSIDRKRISNDIVKTVLTVKESDKDRDRFRLLGARALCDLHESKREEAVVSLACERSMDLIESDAPLDKRFQAGELLGRLGDTRISPDNMVVVPEGEFTRGTNDGDDEEKPERRIYLDAFKIGVYPVTNREFKAFIDAGGYLAEAFWTPEGWEWKVKEDISLPDYWHDRQWNGANFPVVGVSWYEAAAYAEWLSKETGNPYRLPTEAEWEKAARGPDGKIYPWGNDFDKNLCNSGESGLGRISPVGIFPGGKSTFGCFDMAGNVWEWCADWYEETYYRESPLKNPGGPVGGSGRVIRGGSWFYDARLCRAAFRIALRPGLRWYGSGFRLVRSL